MDNKSKSYMAGLLAGLLWLPGALWADCSIDVEINPDTNAVSAYSLSGQGNFSCGALGMGKVSANVTPSGNTLDWTRSADEVDAVAVEDSSGKRCVYNYGPGADGGEGLEPPSNKDISDYLVCADGVVLPVPNTAPTVTITDPNDLAIFDGGEEVYFSGFAEDVEDNDATLTGQLAWVSSLDGRLGSGASFYVSDLSAGTHLITAQVTDEDGLGLTGSDSIELTITAIEIHQCEAVIDVNGVQVGVLINDVEVTCPVGEEEGEPRLVCSADLGDDADKFEIGSTACCVCNTTATECDPNKAELPVEEEPVDGLPACPKTKDAIGGLQVPTTLMLNNDPYYCYTVGGRRTCFAY